MEKKLKNILYILIAVFLLFVSNFLVIKPILKNKDKESLEYNDKTKITALEKQCDKQQKLYSKYSLVLKDVNTKSQEWFKVNLKSDLVIKFQYYNKNSEISKLNITVNDRRIENDEEFFEYDKFKINFHLYGEILVIEHLRSYDHIPFIKIIDLTTGSMKNLSSAEDFYVNEVLVNEYGVKVSYSRLTSKINYFLEKKETNIPFRVGSNNVSLNICDKNLWPEDLKNLDYVYFDMDYLYQDDIIDFNNPNITNMRKLDAFLAPYLKEFTNICKNNN